MKQHTYRITVERVFDRDGQPVADAPITFSAGNHDELAPIVERMRTREGFTTDQAAAFAIGLKLFGETMLERRDDPLFDGLREPFRDFMRRLKGK